MRTNAALWSWFIACLASNSSISTVFDGITRVWPLSDEPGSPSQEFNDELKKEMDDKKKEEEGSSTEKKEGDKGEGAKKEGETKA